MSVYDDDLSLTVGCESESGGEHSREQYRKPELMLRPPT